MRAVATCVPGMRRGPFTAAIVVGVAVPVVALAVAISRPGVRAALKGFVSPLPTTSASSAAGAVSALPAQVVLTGAESSELHGLAAGDAGAPTRRGPRTKLFPTELPANRDPYERPRGLRRSTLAARDDASTDRATQFLHTDAHGHGALTAALQIAGRHRDEVERILQAWKLPAELSAVVFVESGFAPTYSALDGGVGLWSLPREVAHTYGLAVLDNYDERRGVALSTEAAGHYLADLHERFGSWELSIFAYGMGYRPALDALSNRASLDYWELASELPAEGTAYVAQVLAVATLLDNPNPFGLGIVRPDAPEVTSDMEVPGGAGFATIARAAGTSVEHLRELNPEFLGDTVPSTGFVMVMHLPSAGLARAKELLMPLLYSTSGALGRGDSFDWGHGQKPGDAGGDATPPPEDAGPKGGTQGRAGRVFYRVQDGDTLESVSRRFGLPREAIISDNALDPSAGLRPGQLLLLRVGKGGDTQAPP